MKAQFLTQSGICCSLTTKSEPLSVGYSNSDEILSTEAFKPFVDQFKASFPGCLEEAMKKETLQLKPMITLNQSLKEMDESLKKVYGQREVIHNEPPPQDEF